jgi:hypothetical protein
VVIGAEQERNGASREKELWSLKDALATDKVTPPETSRNGASNSGFQSAFTAPATGHGRPKKGAPKTRKTKGASVDFFGFSDLT